MMLLSLEAMPGLEKKLHNIYIYLQWLFHSGERAVASGALVSLVLQSWRVPQVIEINETKMYFLTIQFDT